MKLISIIATVGILASAVAAAPLPAVTVEPPACPFHPHTICFKRAAAEAEAPAERRDTAEGSS